MFFTQNSKKFQALCSGDQRCFFTSSTKSLKKKLSVHCNLGKNRNNYQQFIACSYDFTFPLVEIIFYVFNSFDGRVVKASVSEAVNSGVITSLAKPMTLKLIFKASLLDAQH